MKRILPCALAALLFLSTVLPCFAEEEAGFTFERGARWGMSYAEVLALENADADASHSMDEDVVIWFFEVPGVNVGKYTGDLVYMFIGDELMLIAYRIPEASDASYGDLRGALCSLYGEPYGEDRSALVSFVSDSMQWDWDEAERATENAEVWHVASDADVSLGTAERTIFIVYYDTAYSFGCADFDATEP
ncbi:MAG: hypothetical protein ACOYI8_05880 [Christensenellales bacterium]